MNPSDSRLQRSSGCCGDEVTISTNMKRPRLWPGSFHVEEEKPKSTYGIDNHIPSIRVERFRLKCCHLEHYAGGLNQLPETMSTSNHLRSLFRLQLRISIP